MSRQTAEKNSFPSVNLYKLSDNSVYVDSVFQPDDSDDREFLVFDPLSGNFYTEAQHDDYSPICKPITSEHVHFGLLGILDFHFSKYVFFISDREKVGSISGNDIYRITGVDYVAIGRKVYLSLNEEQFESESLFILKRILSSGWFHYSYTYNLAESMQKQSESWNMSEEAVEKSGGVQDNRFIWNWELLECLAEENLNHFIVPIICGFASTSRISNEELPFSPISCSLITRVDKSRVGRRWYCRGIDFRGNAAFTCESELILSSNQISTSSIQLRGSVPVPWRQVPATFESKPRIQIPSPDESTLSAVRKNVYHLIELYGDCITFLNLLDDEWEEKDLVHLYQQSMSMLNDERLHYLHHRISDKNRECYESIRPVVKPIVSTTGCFVADQDRGIVYQSQNGVIRTNCLDSLDRTNLVQFFISNEYVLLQLKHLLHYSNNSLSKSSLKSKNALADPEQIFTLHLLRPLELLYLSNGDSLSDFNTGTNCINRYALFAPLLSVPAPSQDTATPTPHRSSPFLFPYRLPFKLPSLTITTAPSISSHLHDTYTRLCRLYINYFSDPRIQDGFDLLLGNLSHPSNSSILLNQLTLQRRLSEIDCSQSWYTWLFIFLRKRIAPLEINSTFSFVVAMTWVMVTWIYVNILGVKVDKLFRKPKMSQLYLMFENDSEVDLNTNGIGIGSGSRRAEKENKRRINAPKAGSGRLSKGKVRNVRRMEKRLESGNDVSVKDIKKMK